MAVIYYAVNGDFMRYNKTYLDFRKTQTYKTDGKTFSKKQRKHGINSTNSNHVAPSPEMLQA
jgi:hypothetical protein